MNLLILSSSNQIPIGLRLSRLALSGCLFVCLCLIAAVVHGQNLAVGDPFPVPKAEDQHGESYLPAEDGKYAVVSFDMATSKRANQYFKEKGAGWLEKHQSVYMANIHGMPGIGRMFAFRKMRKYPHRIVLLDIGPLENYPQETDKLTIFEWDDAGKIIKISYWDGVEKLYFE